MFDENGKVMSEKEILKASLDHIAEAAGFLFECESIELKSLAFHVDSILKLGTVLVNDDCPLDAACDYTKYENEKYQEFLEKKKSHLKVIK